MVDESVNSYPLFLYHLHHSHSLCSPQFAGKVPVKSGEIPELHQIISQCIWGSAYMSNWANWLGGWLDGCRWLLFVKRCLSEYNTSQVEALHVGRSWWEIDEPWLMDPRFLDPDSHQIAFIPISGCCASCTGNTRDEGSLLVYYVWLKYIFLDFYEHWLALSTQMFYISLEKNYVTGWICCKFPGYL